MATIVQEFGASAEITEFSGSSTDDSEYAKSFWQSVQLLPPIESRLYSSSISQRLRTAQPSSHRGTGFKGANVASQNDPPQLQSFFARARALEAREEQHKLNGFAKMRREDIALLNRHRQQRIEKEKLSDDHKGVTKPPKDTQLVLATENKVINNENTLNDNKKEAQDALNDMRTFEEKQGYKCDSDSD